jgi:hypothetical protein
VLGGACLLLLGWVVSPTPDRDASYFLGASMSLAAGDGLVNRVDRLLPTQDPEGQARFVAYPPVFPIVLGFIGGADVRRSTMAVGLLATIALLLTAFLLRDAAASGPLAALVASAGVASYASAFANSAVRPEALSAGLVVLAILALPRLPASRRREILLGCFVGALALVQLPLGLYGLLGWSCWIAFECSLRDAVPRGIVLGIAALGAYAAGLLLHPFGAQTFLAAFGHFASAVLGYVPLESVSSYWLFGKRFPGLAIPVLLGVALGLWKLRTRRPRSVVLLGLGIAGAAILLVRNSVLAPSRWYEASLFLPLAYLAIADALRPGVLARPVRAAVVTVALLGFVVNGAGVGRRVLSWASNRPVQMSFEQSRRSLRDELRVLAPAGMVATTSEAWMLVPDFHRACVVSLADDAASGTTCGVTPRVLVLQQAQRVQGERAPAEVLTGAAPSRGTATSPALRWRLVSSHFDGMSTGLARRLSVRVSGWGYAVYVRVMTERAGPLELGPSIRPPSPADATRDVPAPARKDR